MRNGQQTAFILLILVGILYWLHIRGRLAPAIRVLQGDPPATIPGGLQSYPVQPGNGMPGVPPPPGMGIGGNLTPQQYLDYYNSIVAQQQAPSTARQIKNQVRDIGLSALAATGPVGAIASGILKGIGIKL